MMALRLNLTVVILFAFSVVMWVLPYFTQSAVVAAFGVALAIATIGIAGIAGILILRKRRE